MLSNHINLSAGAQNITGAYVIIMPAKTMRLAGKAVTLEKQQKLFVQGYSCISSFICVI